MLRMIMERFSKHPIVYRSLCFLIEIAAGEFTTLTSLEDPAFKIQERTCGQASVLTGVALKDKDKPVIQVSTPRAGSTSPM